MLIITDCLHIYGLYALSEKEDVSLHMLNWLFAKIVDNWLNAKGYLRLLNKRMSFILYIFRNAKYWSLY